VEWIAKAVKNANDPRYSVHETLQGILTGRYQLLRYENGIIVTANLPDRLVVHLGAGHDWLKNKDEWMRDLWSLADLLGLDYIETHCRPGMEKAFRALGWKKERVSMYMRRKSK
jgi:hypothetical protein